MILNPEAVAAYTELMCNPAKHGLKFQPLEECFDFAQIATPKHILFKQYTELIQSPVPKVIFYIVMDEKYPVAKASNGDLGYLLTIKPQP